MVAELISERIYSVEEYLELEQESETKHEFVNGKRIEMPGESLTASEIAGLPSPFRCVSMDNI
ncbi:MAG: Uma2 family endonuclease [Rudanella sp.]|nr:Uma2 family endonuclease [Rudanella sp.]